MAIPKRFLLAATVLLLALAGPALPGVGPSAQAEGGTEQAEPILVPPDWSLRPRGVRVGGEFRLIVVTRAKRDSMSADIADYDAHVQADLAASYAHPDIRPYADQFRVIGSTNKVAARDHIGAGLDNRPGVRLYWLDGALIARDYDTFFSDDWHSLEARRADGETIPNNQNMSWYILTGTNSDGASASSRTLGTTQQLYGRLRVAVGHLSEGDMLDDYGFEVPPRSIRPLYAISPVFRVLEAGTPYVAGVEITSDAGPDGDYGPGDVIRVKATFDQAVDVTGRPQVELRLGMDNDYQPPAGSNVVRATYVAADSNATELVFDYTVRASDRDNDGVSIARGSIRLNGGTIKKQGDSVDANLYNAILLDSAAHRVNCIPYISHLSVRSQPQASNDEYGLGETIELGVRFSEPVLVDTNGGRPDLGVQVGTSRVRAVYRRVDGSTVVFGHVVAEGQLDVDGIRIKTNHLWLNGAVIRSVATDRDADVAYMSRDFGDHMVDAGLTPPTSSDATLGGLDLTGVVLQPAFDPDVTEYMGTAPSSVSETTIHAPPSDAGAAVAYSVADSNAEADGRQASLSVGKTTLTVSVRAQDAVATETYTVHVVRRMEGALPDVSIESTESSVTEGTAATFTLTRTAPNADALTVSLDVSQTGAVIATENAYEPPSEVSFAAGATTATITVSTQSDTTDEPDGTLTATLMPLATYTTDATPSAEVAVADDDETPSVTLLLDPASIAENGGSSAVTATLDHPSSAVTTLGISANPVEPASATDFTVSSNATLSIPAGETASAGTVTIEAVDNSLGAADKVVTISATATNAQGVNVPPSLGLTIADDESAPEAPMHLTATAGDGQITLAWDAPDSTADITRHEYRYAEGSTEYVAWNEIGQSAPGQDNEDGVTVTGLDNGQTYTLQVRALNSSGASEPSMSAEAFSGAGFGICDRTHQVRDGILLLIDADDVSDCADVLDTHLAAITGTLRLAHTGITSLRPGDFGGLSGLTTLKLYSDPLPSPPDGIFSDLSSLTHLELHHNQFTELSAGTFTGLTSLRYLDVSYNRITSIDDAALSGLTTLENLDLSQNKVMAITAGTFSGLTNLQVLDLGDNLLSALPDNGFSDLSSLETLKLRDSRISTFTPAKFAGLSSITTLSLIGNDFTVHSMHAPFGELTTLEALNIEFGWIQETFPTDLFKNLTSLRSVLAMGNYREGNILEMPVTLGVTDDNKLEVRARSGAPFNIEVPVRITNGSLAGGVTSLTIPVGKTRSEAVAFSRTAGTTGAVAAQGQLPPLPSTTTEGGYPLHEGYRVSAGPNFEKPLQLIAALPRIRLSLSPAAVLERDDAATTTVNEARTTVTASLARPASTAFTVTIAVAPVGSATAGDYTLSTNTTLSFAANARTSTGTVTITAVDNDASSGDRTYTVSGALSAAVADGPGAVTLTIHDDEPPAAPSGLSLAPGDGEVRVRWDAPASDDGIDGYEYRYKEDSAADYPATWSEVRDGYRGSSGRGYRVRGLTNDVAYRVQVRAVNMAGAEGAAATSDATTPLQPPQVELNLSRTTIAEQDDPLTEVSESVTTVTATVSRAVNAAFSVTVTATDSSRYTFSEDRLLSFAANSTTSTGVVTVSVVPNTASEPDVAVTVSADISAAGRAADVAAPEDIALTIVDNENMAPTSADATVSTAEDTNHVFQASDFPFADGDTGDALASVGILDLPRSGSLRFGDAALGEGYKVDASELGELIFAPAPNAHGSSYASFRFTVSDGEASSTVSTMTIAVTAVNDPPVFEGASALSAMEGQTDAGLVVAADADRGESVQYAITGGADSGAFAIDAATGRLTFTAAPDFDSPTDQASTEPANAAANNEYVVVVTATGGSGPRALTAEETFIVAVTEAVETIGGEREVLSVTITSAPGDDGFYAVDDVVTIEVTFSGVVAVEPTPRISVGLSTTTANDGERIVSAGSACYVSGSGSASLRFRYAAREGQRGRLVAQALVADDESATGTGTIYSGTMDNAADLAFEATTADDAQAVDAVRPALKSSRIAADRSKLVLVFTEDLATTTAPPSAFTVTVGDAAATVSSVSAADREVTLTLASAVGSGQRVEVAYSEPTEIDTQPPADEVCGLDFASDDANAVQDVAGNDARSFDVVVDVGAAPLTATFVDMPAEHDGLAPFAFRLSFSEVIATSYVWVRDTAMSVNGGSVTAVHRVQGRSDLWNVTVQPSGRGDIAVTLPALTACSDPNTLICTRDKRPLSAGITAGVAGPPGEPEPLTAEFTNIPREHDGATPFSVRIQFSSPISTSYVTMEERSVTVASGTVAAARRVDGQRDFWEVDVAPDWYQDVTIMLAADEGCGGANSVCTSDARALTNAPSITVKSRPQPWLSISDARAREGPDATLTFHVTLSHAAPVPVTADYATVNGEAKAGEDYTATSGTLTFAPGELTRTVSVSVLDDSNVEGANGVEGMRLVLSDASGASIRDETGVGYISDTN